MARRKKHPGAALATVCGGLVLGAAILWQLAGGAALPPLEDLTESLREYLTQPVSGAPSQEAPPAPVEGELRVHMIDVGQGDSLLIQTEDQAVLIDSGEEEYGDTVSAYLENQGVEQLDLVVATHPHSDHMGSMAQIVEEWQVDQFLMPVVPQDLTPTSQVYEDLLTALEEKGLSIAQPETGAVYDLGDGASLTILAPVDQYDDLNNWSIVCRLDYGETSFLFTGDAEKAVERDLLEAGADLDADLLKVGHHGSSTSTGKTFLEAVSPQYGLISCGMGNRYGHPNEETLDTLEEAGVEVYRTDISGSIVALSDGETITITTQQ